MTFILTFHICCRDSVIHLKALTQVVGTLLMYCFNALTQAAGKLSKRPNIHLILFNINSDNISGSNVNFSEVMSISCLFITFWFSKSKMSQTFRKTWLSYMGTFYKNVMWRHNNDVKSYGWFNLAIIYLNLKQLKQSIIS